MTLLNDSLVKKRKGYGIWHVVHGEGRYNESKSAEKKLELNPLLECFLGK